MLFLLSRFLLALSTIGVIVAVPLGIEYDKTAGLTAEELANKGRLDTATTLAHTQVGKMREGLNKVKSGDAKATALYEASFGKNANIAEVDKNVAALETGKIKANVATHPFTGGEIAAIPWSKEGKQPWTPGNAQFSHQFHGGGAEPLDDAGRAGTLIHEATHQLSKTGDDINKSGKIIKPYDGTSKPTGKTGYTLNHNMHKTAAAVNKDKAFTDVRDSAPNMHENAESYAVFASLCSQPGALRRRDVHLYNRALLQDDHQQLHHLARRNSCKLPPDYFAKKAAAKKAAALKTTSGAVKPALHSKVATKGSKSAAVPPIKASHAGKGLGVKTAMKGAKATRLTKTTASKSLKSVNGLKTAKARLNRHAVKSSKALFKANKQTTKGHTRTAVKDAKAKSNKQRTPAPKPLQAHSHTKAALRRGSSKVAAVHHAKAAHSKKQKTHVLKSSRTKSAPRKGSSKVAAVHHAKATHSIK